MKTIQERRIEALDETAKVYNFKNRSKDTETKSCGVGCFYHKQPNKEQGCAIGRLIRRKSITKKLDDDHPDSTVSVIFELLPTYVKELGLGFLSALQGLHDDDDCWGKNGLSTVGEQRVKLIKTIYIDKNG